MGHRIVVWDFTTMAIGFSIVAIIAVVLIFGTAADSKADNSVQCTSSSNN